MSKVFLLVSAFLLGGAASGLPPQTALAAEAESAAAAKKACEREAVRRHYTGKQRSRFIRQCLAKKDQKPDEEIVLPDRDPFSPPVVPLPLLERSLAGTVKVAGARRSSSASRAGRADGRRR